MCDIYYFFQLGLNMSILQSVLSACLEKNCVENCSMSCGDPGLCDKVTGDCNRSCLPGWEGNMCQNGNNL